MFLVGYFIYRNVPVYGVDYICFIKAAILVFKMAVIKRKKIVQLSSKSLHVPILHVQDACEYRMSWN